LGMGALRGEAWNLCLPLPLSKVSTKQAASRTVLFSRRNDPSTV